MDKKNYDTLDIFVYLWQNRKIIITITLIGAIVAAIASLMLKNQYKAVALAYPTKFISLPISSFNQSYNQENDPMIIGGEGEAERMIQILKSDIVFYNLNKKYNLTKIYKINEQDRYVLDKTKKYFNENVSIKKTKYYAVEISFINEDPKLAASIANDIMYLYDTIMDQIQKNRALELYEVTKYTYEKQLEYIKSLEDSLSIFRKKGILLYGSDVDRLNEAYWKSLGRGTLTNQAELKFIRMKDTIIKYSETIRHIEKEIEISMSIALDMRTKMIRAKANLEQPYSRQYTVSPATVPQKKFSPKRSLIVLFSTIGAFVFSFVVLLFVDFYKEIKNRIKDISLK